MQLLLSRAAYERIEPQLQRIAPDLDVVTVGAAETLEHNGIAIDPNAIDPHIAYMSFELLASGLLPMFLARVAAAQKLQWMQLLFAGLDHSSCKPAILRGVRLTKSTAQAISVAEYVIAHAFSLLFPIDLQRELQAKKDFRRTPFQEIGRTRWTIIGFGEMGTAIAKRIKPFGVHVTAVRQVAAPSAPADRTIDLSGLPAALAESDVVVLACSLNDQTRRLAGDGFFNTMKAGAILINSARGALIDEDALQRGLERDRPARAVLDVFTTEPLPPTSWMWTHPKIRVTGHTSNDGDGRTTRGDEQFLANLQRFLDGAPLLNEARSSEFSS
jgi:phosphoglycerate dehydrogenase-like enzyme